MKSHHCVATKNDTRLYGAYQAEDGNWYLDADYEYEGGCGYCNPHPYLDASVRYCPLCGMYLDDIKS